jgi:hypothetical protein
MRRTLLGSLLALSSLACAEKEAPVSELVDAVVDELNSQVTIACDCYAEAGYASASECETDLGFIGPSQRRCVIEAYQEDEAAARSYLECLHPLEVEYTACTDERLDCSDFTSADVCGTDYSVGFEECIQLPQSVIRDLEACFE